MGLKIAKNVEQIIRLTDFLPLRSYFSVFNTVSKDQTPDIYVLDLAGVDSLDKNVLGLIVLLKQHANSAKVDFKITNHTQLLEQMDSSPRYYQSLFV